MPRSPFDPTPLRPPPDPDDWAEYERLSRRAANQYRVTPIAHNQRAYFYACYICDNPTESNTAICFRCKG